MNNIVGFLCDCKDGKCSKCQARGELYPDLYASGLLNAQIQESIMSFNIIKCFEIVSLCDKCDGKGELEKEIDGVTYKGQCPECKGEKFAITGAMLLREVPYDAITVNKKKKDK